MIGKTRQPLYKSVIDMRACFKCPDSREEANLFDGAHASQESSATVIIIAPRLALTLPFVVNEDRLAKFESMARMLTEITP
jgi:hypothetical protein